MSLDPFSLVFNGLWSLMDDNPLMTAVVRDGNKVKFNGDKNRDPIKQAVQDADMPELLLVSDGPAVINLHATSCSSMLIRRYSWIISTGDQRINERLHPVEWAVFIGMLNWRSVLTSLEWEGEKFVKRANLLDASNGFSDSERNRGLKGWSALWRCEVEMHFNTATLMNQLGGSTSGSS